MSNRMPGHALAKPGTGLTVDDVLLLELPHLTAEVREFRDGLQRTEVSP